MPRAAEIHSSLRNGYFAIFLLLTTPAPADPTARRVRRVRRRPSLTRVPSPILAGAEPASLAGGPDGVIVIHGFTGNPFSMRPLARAIAAAGYTVELPLLPGHGRSVEDMMPTGWSDWSGEVEGVYRDLAARCERVAVAGLSMGGTLAVWLAAHHPDIAALVTVNAAVEPGGGALVDMARTLLDEGTVVLPGIGSDIARPDAVELSYDGVPVAALMS